MSEKSNNIIKYILIGIGAFALLLIALFIIFAVNLNTNKKEHINISEATTVSSSTDEVIKTVEPTISVEPTTEINTQQDEEDRPPIDESEVTENTLESKYAAFLALPRSEIRYINLPAGSAYGTDEIHMSLADLKLMGSLTDDQDVSYCIKKMYETIKIIEEKCNTNSVIMFDSVYHSTECGRAYKEYLSELNLFSESYLSDLSSYLDSLSDSDKDNFDLASCNLRYPNIPFINPVCNYKITIQFYTCIKNEVLDKDGQKIVKLEIMTPSGFIYFYFKEENNDWLIYHSDYTFMGGNPGVTVPQFADKQP